MAQELTVGQVEELHFRDDDIIPTNEVWLKLHNQLVDWLVAGKGIAVYENRELGHPQLGHIQIISFGTPSAGLAVDEPPEIMPDFPDKINWRYVLVGTVPKGGS